MKTDEITFRQTQWPLWLTAAEAEQLLLLSSVSVSPVSSVELEYALFAKMRRLVSVLSAPAGDMYELSAPRKLVP
jgi:hypothetical protein